VLARIWARIRFILRRYFVAGILTFAPIGITIWAIAWIVQRLDSLLLPGLLRFAFPGVEEPPQIPFLGAIFTLLVILLFGVIARHLFGWELVRLSERVLSRVPVARNIYGGVKQLFEAIFLTERGASFRRVVLVEYPRRGAWALGFTTGPASQVLQSVSEEDLVNVFVPTTPNPTSGFYLVVPERDLHPLDVSVEQAFKLVMSAGLVDPHAPARDLRGGPPEAPAEPPLNAPAPSAAREEDAGELVGLGLARLLRAVAPEVGERGSPVVVGVGYLAALEGDAEPADGGRGGGGKLLVGVEHLRVDVEPHELFEAVVGAGSEGLFWLVGREETRAFVEQTQGGKNPLTLLEPQADFSGLLNAVDVFVSASRREGLPYAILEAMACEKLVVASAIEGASESYGRSDGVWLFPRGRADRLAELLRWALGLTDADRRALGRANRVFVEAHFGLDRWAEQIVRVYSHTLGS